jgi:hypothetical protein
MMFCCFSNSLDNLYTNIPDPPCHNHCLRKLHASKNDDCKQKHHELEVLPAHRNAAPRGVEPMYARYGWGLGVIR